MMATNANFSSARRKKYMSDAEYREILCLKSKEAYYLRKYPEWSLRYLFADPEIAAKGT